MNKHVFTKKYTLTEKQYVNFQNTLLQYGGVAAVDKKYLITPVVLFVSGLVCFFLAGGVMPSMSNTVTRIIGFSFVGVGFVFALLGIWWIDKKGVKIIQNKAKKDYQDGIIEKEYYIFLTTGDINFTVNGNENRINWSKIEKVIESKSTFVMITKLTKEEKKQKKKKLKIPIPKSQLDEQNTDDLRALSRYILAQNYIILNKKNTAVNINY